MPGLTILIIRHAEKPGEAWPGPGLRVDGTQDNEALVIRGWQRAGSWAALFGPGLGWDYPQPQLIFAADPRTPPGGKEPSQRPFETILPLADRLGMDHKPIKTFAKGQERELAQKLASLDGVDVLVAWEHEAIVESLLPAIAAGQHISGMPTHWDGARFDVVLRFDRAAPGLPWSFRQLLPRLLSGDSDVPLR